MAAEARARPPAYGDRERQELAAEVGEGVWSGVVWWYVVWRENVFALLRAAAGSDTTAADFETTSYCL